MTEFWKLSAVKEIDFPSGFGVECTLAGFLDFPFLIGVAFMAAALVFVSGSPELAEGESLFSDGTLSAAAVGAGAGAGAWKSLVLLSPGFGNSGPPTGRDPGLIVSNVFSTKSLSGFIFFAPVNLSTSSPSLYKINVGKAPMPWAVQVDPKAIQSREPKRNL